MTNENKSADICAVDYRDLIRNYSNIYEMYSEYKQETARLSRENENTSSEMAGLEEKMRSSSVEKENELTAKLADAENNAKKLMQENEDLKHELDGIKEELAKLKNGGSEVSEYARERLKRYTSENCSDPEEVAARIILSPEFADGMAEIQEPMFMEIVNSNAARIALRVGGNYRQMPLICYGDMITLNPFYYSDMETGSESYGNIKAVEGVFKIEGLQDSSASYANYGLDRVFPAELEKDGDNFYLKTRGTLRVEKTN